MISKLKPITDNYIGKLSSGLTNLAGAKKMNQYVNDRIVENALKLGDSFSNTKKMEYLGKVSKKATSDWINSHKLRSFVIKNSDKIAKGSLLGIAAVSVGALAAGLISLVNKPVDE